MSDAGKKSESELLAEEYEAATKAREARLRAAETDPAALRLKIANVKALDECEQKHGVVASHETSDGIVIVRRPEMMRWRKYQAVTGKLLGEGSESANAKFSDEAHKMVASCLVHPTKEAFEAIAEKFPGVSMILAGKLADLAAGRDAEAVKK
jgi:hypothetical protein